MFFLLIRYKKGDKQLTNQEDLNHFGEDKVIHNLQNFEVYLEGKIRLNEIILNKIYINWDIGLSSINRL
ncbi:hypothetical protein GCM10011346_36620 [Oceanobacillus neutriphilus]|uniref:Uncharacterized protein n=1 Tax=Oceanobacillus neutriphilus TaxID=531815 RepID=A0ABQ2NZD6_9BACI|nr:hypothetical protein GCM10011346_36620 [Oceanobacillus neutriphilus]